MAQKRTARRRANLVARVMGGAVVSCVLVACVGLGFASAQSGISADADAFGIDAMSSSHESGENALVDTMSDAGTAGNTQLAVATTRDISAGIASIEAEEEAARKAAEEAARREEEARIAAAEAKRAEQEAVQADTALAQLSEVDWNVGKDAFIAEWTTRIDNYLVGTALAGYGNVFAEAAWENGVDPRFSPAISNTESTNGAHCFKSCNAWGWGDSSWSSWEEAIRAHVAGLANGYGYTLSYENAAKYCPPNTAHWFNNTLSQMQQI